jgi:UDP-N-acetylglucosamine 2-epimerase
MSLAKAGYDVSLIVSDGLPDEIKDGVKIYGVKKDANRLSRILKSPKRIYKKAFFFHRPYINLYDVVAWVELVQSDWNALVVADKEKIVDAIKNLKIPEIHPDFCGDG